MLRKIISGISAGILISLGGAVFLSCENRYVGAVLFSVALLCICLLGYNLFTGKVCFMALQHGKEEWSVLLTCLLGNLIGTVICGYAMRFAIPSLGDNAYSVCMKKLELTHPQIFIRAIFCGILIYLAVAIFKNGKNIWGILFCIPVFILSGFEHSIADMYYFSASGIVSFNAFSFIMVVILGNSVGGLLLPAINKIQSKEE